MTARDNSNAGSDAKAVRKPLRIHGTIARNLGILIVSGRYSPGKVLGNEVSASDKLHVSRTAYREALRILHAKGLVESRPRTGTRVSDRTKWHLLDPDVLSWMFEFEPDDALLFSLFELRKIIEPEAAALAAARRSAAHLERMADALARMAQFTLAAEEGRVADQDFHSALLEASANPFLQTLTTSVSAAVSWTTVFKQRKEPLRRDPIPDHQRVYDAIAAGDAQAAHREMTRLVDMAFLDTTNARP